MRVIYKSRERCKYGLGHERRNIAAHLGDLPHQCGGNGAILRAGRKKHRVDVGRHGPVHARHLHFVVQVGAVAQAAHQNGRSRIAGGVDHQIAETLHPDAVIVVSGGLQRLRDQFGALFEAEHRFLAGVNADADDDLVEHRKRLAQDVQMSVRQRVEGTGIIGNSCHLDPPIWRVLSRQRESRKPAASKTASARWIG
jgi:hypothetical protein